MVYVSYVAARRAVAAADYLLVPLTLQVRIWAWAPGTGEAAETGVWSQQACISLSSPGTAVVRVLLLCTLFRSYHPLHAHAMNGEREKAMLTWGLSNPCV